MATQLQKDLAEAMVLNAKLPRDKRKNKGELLESVGYSTKVAKHKPKEILNQKGVKEALQEYGLTEGLVVTALVSDIKGKPKKRVKELGLAADILGLREQSKNDNKTLVVLISGQTADRYGINRTLSSTSSDSD